MVLVSTDLIFIKSKIVILPHHNKSKCYIILLFKFYFITKLVKIVTQAINILFYSNLAIFLVKATKKRNQR